MWNLLATIDGASYNIPIQVQDLQGSDNHQLVVHSRICPFFLWFKMIKKEGYEISTAGQKH